MTKYLVKAVNYSNGKLVSDWDSDFVYPFRGPIEAKGWSGDEKCGGGIHGIDENNFMYPIIESGNCFIVISFDSLDGFVELGDKIKIKKGEVVFLSKKIEKIQKYLSKRGVVYRGYKSILTGRYKSTCQGGDKSILTGGDWSILTGGDKSTCQGGDWSTLTGGDGSTCQGGDWSTLTGGDGSTLTGRYKSTLTGGYKSILTGGDKSTIIGGDKSTLTGGYGSVLIWKYLDDDDIRKVIVKYVGEDGIKPNTSYEMIYENGNIIIKEVV